MQSRLLFTSVSNLQSGARISPQVQQLYDDLWRRILAAQRHDGMPADAGAFVDWGNTPRYERTARVVLGASPERFRFWLSQLVDALSTQPPDHRLIFVNAWNEWAEGTYLEPDEHHGYGYLEAVRDSVIRTEE